MSISTSMAVITSLSQLIWEASVSLSSEETQPGYGPDTSDAKCKMLRERLSQLRNMREHFEALMTVYS